MMHPGFPSRIPNAQCPMQDREKFNDLMNQTDIEMQRLGWTIPQAREHLHKTCQVRSRLLLTEEELDNFLLFLQLTESPTHE
ncbi:hypothetical protein [Nostoc sp.]|uniref:hypothetical protein n=1 Tax=Nostoc sp. TaxID=1180 RepID=UPI003592EFB8